MIVEHRFIVFWCSLWHISDKYSKKLIAIFCNSPSFSTNSSWRQNVVLFYFVFIIYIISVYSKSPYFNIENVFNFVLWVEFRVFCLLWRSGRMLEYGLYSTYLCNLVFTPNYSANYSTIQPLYVVLIWEGNNNSNMVCCRNYFAIITK